MPSLHSRWTWFAVAVFILAVFARWLPGPRIVDDAYITFRYARNILAGDGFVYNPGERVLGTTTPLFTVLMVALGSLSGGAHAPFSYLAIFVSALADGLSACLLFLVGKRLGAEWAGAGAALAWAIAPFSVTFAIGGLETSIYVLLLIGTCWSYIEKRYTIAALLGAFSLLARPDVLLLLVPLGFDRLFLSQRRGEPRAQPNELAAFALPVFAWLLFAWIYFGNPLPQSVLAKTAAYRLPPLLATIRLLQHYATPFLEHLSLGLGWIKIGLFFYPFLALVGARSGMKRLPSVWPLAVFPWIYFAAFAIANPLIFRWYLTPPLPFYFLFILIGLETLLWQILQPRRLAVLVPAFLLLPALFSLKGWTIHPAQPPDRPAPAMAWIELELLYKEAAARLEPELAAHPQASLAAADVGVLGYFTNARILDLVGLNSPETLAYYPLNPSLYGDFIYAVSPNLIMNNHPDYVIILEIYGRYGLLKDQGFLASYHLLETIPTQIYGSNGLLIYALDQ